LRSKSSGLIETGTYYLEILGVTTL